MTYSDQTGAFQHTSTKGNRYVMVREDSNTGPVLAIGIKSRKKEHLIAGFITMHETLKKVGINRIIHRIDNEFSKDLIEEIETRKLKKTRLPEITGPSQLKDSSRRLKIILNPSYLGVTLDTPKTNGID